MWRAMAARRRCGGDGEGGYLFVLEAGADVAELLVNAEALLLLVVAFLARI